MKNWHWVNDGSEFVVDWKHWGLGIYFMWFRNFRGGGFSIGPFHGSLGFDYYDDPSEPHSNPSAPGGECPWY